MSQKPGPGRLARPALPSVPGAGCANAAGLNQQPGFGWSQSGFESNRSARWVPPAAPDNWRSMPVVAVMKAPDNTRQPAANLQFEAIIFTVRLANSGDATTPLMFAMCLRWRELAEFRSSGGFWQLLRSK